jgi:polyhydroxyalkanoate synthase
MADSLASLADPAASLTHWRVERWSCDEFALPGRLFTEVQERLYRENQYTAGRLTINGRIARPAATDAPVLSVVQPHSRLITSEMVLAFHALLPDGRSDVLHYNGEVGIGLSHVGPLVGARAHRELWPRIFDWLRQAST